MAQKTKGRRSSPGRATSPKDRRPGSGRYTAPIPREYRHSPRWYPWALLCLLLGVAAIILNYIQALPASPTNWYTLGGLVAILIAAIAATHYR